MSNYKFGFSVKGFLVVLFVMIPNIIWMIIPPVNDVLTKNSGSSDLLYILENIGRYTLILILIILICQRENHKKNSTLYFGLATLFLLGYYILWILYYTGIVLPYVLLGLAFFPSMYFLFSALWLRNYIAIIPCVFFTVMHLVITCLNYGI